MEERRPIKSLTTHRVASFGPHERDALAEQLFPIFSATVSGFELETFRDGLLFGEHVHRLALFHGHAGELAGYITSQAHACVVDGQELLLLGGAVHSDLRYRGAGSMALRFGAVEVLRARLRHPLRRICFAADVMTPSAYRMFADRCFVYPNPDGASPAYVRALLEPAAQMQHVELLDPKLGLARGVLTSGQKLERAEQLRASDSLVTNRNARYFSEHVPHGYHLLVVIPLTATNIVRALRTA